MTILDMCWKTLEAFFFVLFFCFLFFFFFFFLFFLFGYLFIFVFFLSQNAIYIYIPQLLALADVEQERSLLAKLTLIML